MLNQRVYFVISEFQKLRYNDWGLSGKESAFPYGVTAEKCDEKEHFGAPEGR
jgi:hypothetical protein